MSASCIDMYVCKHDLSSGLLAPPAPYVPLRLVVGVLYDVGERRPRARMEMVCHVRIE